MPTDSPGFLLTVSPAVADVLSRSAADLSLEEHASRLLYAAAVLAAPSTPVPLADDVRAIAERHGLAATALATVLGEVVAAAGTHLPPGWTLFRPGASQEYPMSTTPEPMVAREASARYRPSAFGKYAGLPGGSEEYAREKQREIEREDRRRP